VPAPSKESNPIIEEIIEEIAEEISDDEAA